MLTEQRVDLTPFNTLGFDVRADRLITVDDRQQLFEFLQANDQPPMIIGGGSNLVLTQDIHQLCIRVNWRGVDVEPVGSDQLLVTAQAGEPWHDFVDRCVEQGWYGLENLALIPGTVGAAPIQNIGAYGVEVGQRIDAVEVWDFEQRRQCWLSNVDCCFGYRDSLFKQQGKGRYLILSVRFRLSRTFEPVVSYAGLNQLVGEKPSARELFDAVVATRQQKLPDPGELSNAGSFFKNPVVEVAQFEQLQQQYPEIVAYPDVGGVKLAAGWLIDQAGWKGCRQGAVGVHDRQALVLVHYGQGTGKQLLSLARQIQDDVLQRYGIWLEIEPVII